MADDGERIFGANVRATGLAVLSLAGGQGAAGPLRKLELSRLDIDGIEGTVGDATYRLEELSLDGLQTLLGRDRISAEAADAVGFALGTDNVRLSARRVSCPRGLIAVGDRELVAPHVSFEDVRLVVDDLMAIQSQESDRQPMDWHFLDALEGQLDIDVAVDMTLPWIGRRRVTHYFRVPIQQGTIDYKRLEDDVHWLEAAFLTLELVDDRLVLARDLPLVPFSGKALLSWPLEPADIPVADFCRVHIRNLLRPERPPPKSKPDKNKPDKSKSRSKLTLHQLAMENIKLQLATGTPAQMTLPGGAMLQFGDDRSRGLSGLALTGELRFSGDGTEAVEPTSLAGVIDLLDVTLSDIRMGEATLSVDRLHVAGVEQIELQFRGLRPERLEISIDRMAATNLRVQGATG